MRHRPRHTRRRASWGFANFLSLQGTAGANVIAVPAWILPPGRAQWLMEQGRRDHLTCKTIHMWLDFRWVCFAGSFTNPQAVPDVEFYVKKVEASSADDITPNVVLTGANVTSPFATPTPPSAVVDWDEVEADDGTDSFMWSHWMKGGSPPNGVVAAVTISPPTAPNTYGYGNQYHYMFRENEGGGDTALCRTFSTRIEWQPDVIIRSARRLMKGEGIAMVMNVYSVPGDGHIAAQLDMHTRTLVA